MGPITPKMDAENLDTALCNHKLRLRELCTFIQSEITELYEITAKCQTFKNFGNTELQFLFDNNALVILEWKHKVINDQIDFTDFEKWQDSFNATKFLSKHKNS